MGVSTDGPAVPHGAASIPPVAPSGLSNAAIEQYADKVARAHRVTADGRADLDTLVDRLGGTVCTRDGGESLHVRGIGDFTIYLPHLTSRMRDRFTIAHELGHYFLHYRYRAVCGELSYARGGRDRAETEANVFAAALLMPTGPFTARWQGCDGDHWQVAEHFGVSPAAAAVRADTLGLR